MGWVTYDDQGQLVKYYPKPGPAKAAVTRFQNQLRATGYGGYPRVTGCCTYRDFEGVLMGLRGAELKMWQFCNPKLVDRLEDLCYNTHIQGAQHGTESK